MAQNQNIFALTGDLGYGGFQPIMDDFPDRFINVGAAEVSLVTVAIGLALSGKIPFCYSISPFLIFRPFEAIRTYLDHENIPVKLIGSGQTDACYSHEGFSHASYDIPAFLLPLKNVKVLLPWEKEQISGMVQDLIDNKSPSVMLMRQK